MLPMPAEKDIDMRLRRANSLPDGVNATDQVVANMVTALTEARSQFMTLIEREIAVGPGVSTIPPDDFAIMGMHLPLAATELVAMMGVFLAKVDGRTEYGAALQAFDRNSTMDRYEAWQKLLELIRDNVKQSGDSLFAHTKETH